MHRISSRFVSIIFCTVIFFVGWGARSADAQPTATMAAGNGTGSPGDLVMVPIVITGSGAIDGFSAGLSHDATRLTIESAVLGPALDSIQGGVDPSFQTIVIDPGGVPGVVYAVAIDFVAVVTLPAIVTHGVATIGYRINPLSVGGPSPLTFVNTLSVAGGPPVEVLVVITTAIDTVPTITGGSITVVSPSFIRGDVNSSGNVNLADAIHILYITVGLLPAGNCLDAEDLDANGGTTLADGILLLMHLYAGGVAPQSPYPACGVAAAPVLGCAVSSTACP